MNYVTGETIKNLREKKRITQKELADMINVSDKTISKWETQKGLPDISIIEELSRALGVSIAELLTGELKIIDNQSGNMKKIHFYVCPICGNIITSVGQGSFSCCGITLPEQEAEKGDEIHEVSIETIDNEYYVSAAHPMRKEHYISFVAYVTAGTVEIVKLYPEQNIDVRFRKKGHGIFYIYCNKHGLFRQII